MTVAIEISIIFFAWLTIRKQFTFQPRLITTAKLFLASLLMALCLQQLTFLPLMMQILVGAIVYGALVVITKAFRWQDIKPLLFNAKS
jgi:small-conductance mechanosensitive channel